MPVISSELCTQCQKCVQDCPSDAIDIQTWSINETCIHCGHCVAVCPEKAVQPDFGNITPLVDAKVKPEDFIRLTAGVRSCRKYKSKPVPEEILQTLVENMKNYPSASNKRSLKITIVRTPEKIQLLNDMTSETLMKTFKLISGRVVGGILNFIAPDLGINQLRVYMRKYANREKVMPQQICYSAPVVMLFHGPFGKFGMVKDDAVIWATNTTHLAKTMGLGSCFIGFIVKAMESNKTMRKTFHIPENHRVFAALTIGYSKVTYVNEVSRNTSEIEVV